MTLERADDAKRSWSLVTIIEHRTRVCGFSPLDFLWSLNKCKSSCAPSIADSRLCSHFIMLFINLATSLLVLGSASAALTGCGTFNVKPDGDKEILEGWVNQAVERCQEAHPDHHIMIFRSDHAEHFPYEVDDSKVAVDGMLHFCILPKNKKAGPDYECQDHLPFRIIVFQGKGFIERTGGDGGFENWMTFGSSRKDREMIAFE